MLSFSDKSSFFLLVRVMCSSEGHQGRRNLELWTPLQNPLYILPPPLRKCTSPCNFYVPGVRVFWYSSLPGMWYFNFVTTGWAGQISQFDKELRSIHRPDTRAVYVKVREWRTRFLLKL